MIKLTIQFRNALLALSLLMLWGDVAVAESCVTKRGRYKVRIDSVPQGARIYLNDEKCGILGYTPWEGKLPSGTVSVIVKSDGYKLSTTRFVVKRTRRLQETFISMEKKDEAKLDIRGDADPNSVGAEVWVDGAKKGTIPMIITIPSGRHLLELKKPGFATISQWVEASAGERLTMTPTLRQDARGSILVDADVRGAEVWIDGKKHPDPTPTLVSGLAAGAHVIEVKSPGKPDWKQSVIIAANKTEKISATLSPATGVIKILSNEEGATVYLDGKEMGQAPLQLTEVASGEHIIEIKKDGFTTAEQKITVVPTTNEVLKLNLVSQGAPTSTVSVSSNVVGAQIFVNGENRGPVPQELALTAGDYVVEVKKAGQSTYRKRVTLAAGAEPMMIVAEMVAGGELRVLSTPVGASVLINGEEVGVTPLEGEVLAAGDHVVSVQLPGYQSYEANVGIKVGQRATVSAELAKIGAKPPRPPQMQREFTSQSARAIPVGRAIVDLGSGWPYFGTAAITVGVGKIGDLDFDAGGLIRTNLLRTELGLTGRMTFFNQDPFYAAAFARIGGGGFFFDNSGRNSFFMDLGGRITLMAAGAISFNIGTYLHIYSDRHCPTYNASTNSFATGDEVDKCREYALGQTDTTTDRILDGDKLWDRDGGVRLMFEFGFEYALSDYANFFALVEGAPFQEQRLGLRNDFNGLLFSRDRLIYLRGGMSFKF